MMNIKLIFHKDLNDINSLEDPTVVFASIGDRVFYKECIRLTSEAGENDHYYVVIKQIDME